MVRSWQMCGLSELTVFCSVWQFVMKNFLSLTHHQPRSIKRWKSDCLQWTTEKHCTYATIQTLCIRRQQRGAWWEISTAFKVSNKLKHSSSTKIRKIWTIEQRFSWDHSGLREFKSLLNLELYYATAEDITSVILNYVLILLEL